MLQITSLYAGYEGIEVLHSISMSVGQGEIVALVGVNGAGKSTILKAISGLIPIKSGSISLNGELINRLPPSSRVVRGIAHVPEGRQIFGGMTVFDNLRLGAYVRRRELSEAEYNRQIQEVCAHFPILVERLHEPAGILSGGQQQMLAIARGLMAKPRLLLLDEPSLGLAPKLVTEVLGFIANLRDLGISILLSEQNAKLALAMADRAYVIETGRVVLSGNGRDLLGQSAVTERYLGIGAGARIGSDPRQDELARRLIEALAIDS